MSIKTAKFAITQMNHNATAKLVEVLLKEGKVKFGDVGVLSLKKMKSKFGFNPHTQKREKFPAFIKVTFAPSKNFKEAVQIWK